LLDSSTTQIISIVFSQSQLLAKEIYLIDKIDSKREKMRHLKCITFLRPTPASIQALSEELRDPCFGEYYLYFSNSIQKSFIERLAESDTHEVVREVQEYFADYIAVNPDFFSLNASLPDYQIYAETSKSWDPNTLTRVTEGLSSILLSLKKKPLIRYESNSILCKKLASEIAYTIQNEGPLFDFRKPDSQPLLVLLDRRNDPITPLLNPWTYQAMVHELVGISNGRVDLPTQEIVLTIDDTFFQSTMFLNFGDLGSSIKTLVEEFQKTHHSQLKLTSIEEMKKFIENYPDFKKVGGNVSRHVSLVSELSKRVEGGRLLELGELEQSLAVSNSHSVDSKILQGVLRDDKISLNSKVKLVLLYAIRYEKYTGNMTRSFCEILKSFGASEDIVAKMLVYGGVEARMDPVIDILATTKNVFKGLKGVENVYTQYVPRLNSILNDIVKNKLGVNYPFLEGSTKDKPQDVILFMVGGVTYAEAVEVAKMNAAGTGVRFVLGGTSIHNSTR
jgi:vacuolar protein sorting-associated protein 45